MCERLKELTEKWTQKRQEWSDLYDIVLTDATRAGELPELEISKTNDNIDKLEVLRIEIKRMRNEVLLDPHYLKMEQLRKRFREIIRS